MPLIVDELITKYDLRGTYAYLDNISVSGFGKCNHDAKLNALLKAAQAENLTFTMGKCVFNVIRLTC